MKTCLQKEALLQPRTLRVAIAGNPNSGKTSLFNALTGAHQRVGNYPGVTVERREGRWRRQRQEFIARDLPGTYSLVAWSPEERIARDELLDGEHDVVVVVVDSLTLRRSLILLLQVMQTGANPVLCLNMTDEARRAGQRIDVQRLSRLLGVPVVETVAHRGEGLDALAGAVLEAARRPLSRAYRLSAEPAAGTVAALVAALGAAGLPARGRDWLATRLLLGDAEAAARLRERNGAGTGALATAAAERDRLEREAGADVELVLTQSYAADANALVQECLVAPARPDARSATERVDALLANRVLGLPLFLGVMFAIFWITFRLGEAPMNWIEAGVAALGDGVDAVWPAGRMTQLRSLLTDGVIGGVGAVLVFLPNIVLLFLGLSFLEDTGYLARAAFLIDRLMHRFGLHGKSFIPMLTGFGCSIPGVMATRTLENERDRLATMLVLPLMSCGARLPIWMLLIPAFFPRAWQAPALWGIYFAGIALALALALLLRRSLLRGEESPFVMELPPYRLPTPRALVQRMIERSLLYLRKAGTVILAISIVLWAITTWPRPDSYAVDAEIAGGAALTEEQIEAGRAAEELRHSLAGRLGVALEPVFRPLGFDWRIVTASIGAFAAKEVFVAQMGIVYALGEVGEDSKALRDLLRRDYSPLVGVSLMLFLLIGTPCMATFAVVRRESGSWKWAALQFGGLTALAYALALLVYQAGRLIA